MICKQCDVLVADNQKLKQSVIDWKDAWFHLRDIIGNLWWHHPALKQNKPAESPKDWGVWVEPRNLQARFQMCDSQVATFTKEDAHSWAEQCNSDHSGSRYIARKL